MIEKMIDGSNIWIWQEGDSEVSVGEPAVHVEDFPGSKSIELTQEWRSVILNYETIPGICKILKQMVKDGEGQ